MTQENASRQQHAPVYRFLHGAARVLTALIAPIRYTGREKLDAMEAPFIIIGNHSSWLDPVVMALAFRKREVTFLGKKELGKKKIFDWLLKKIHAVLVTRGGTDMEAMRACMTALRKGEILGIFPEGTRYHKGVMEEIEAGVAMIALRSGKPMIPFYLEPTPGLFRVNRCHVGDPIPVDDLREEGINTETCRKLLARITETYAAMMKDAGR